MTSHLEILFITDTGPTHSQFILHPPEKSLETTRAAFSHSHSCTLSQGFPGGSVVKNLPASVGDVGSIPGGEHRVLSLWCSPTPCSHPHPSSPDWDSRFPLIAPQRRSLWLPQACSGPVPLLSGPPPCSSLAEKAQGWGQVGRYLWPGGRGTGLGQSPSQRARPGRALGSWSKERSGVKAMNTQACAHFPRLHPPACTKPYHH